MKQTALASTIHMGESTRTNTLKYLFILIAGLCGSLGFAPFHMPGFTILSLAFFFINLQQGTRKEAFYLGLFYGIGYFGFGVSWVIVSIHDYGQLNYLLSTLITLLFVLYLALFPGLVAYCFKLLALKNHRFYSIVLFSVLWCLGEYVRSTLFTGFPWLLVGTVLIDTPIKYISPLLGIYGLSLFFAFISSFLTFIFQERSEKRFVYALIFTALILLPITCKNINWTTIKTQATTIGAVQANLSMRDKWDETLFWNLLKHYEKGINQLLGKQLIILPESAIPLPANYLEKFLKKLHDKTLNAHSALMLGILQPSNENEMNYYNSILTLGQAQGGKFKRHLVPFGEYIPKPLVRINHWFNLPEPNMVPGKIMPLIKIANVPIASLICYEIAYPAILREQMPEAQWIVSISDNGWFGHSLASYQQLQMAQVLSLLTGRYQVVVNNDGLSSIIDAHGTLINTLSPFSAGILEGVIYPAIGQTPWIIYGEFPVLIFCGLFILIAFLRKFRTIAQEIFSLSLAGRLKRSYP